MEDSPKSDDQIEAQKRYLDKLYMQQFSELRKLKRDRKLTAAEKIKVKRQIIIKYKALRRKASNMEI